ncbi:MAG: twin-arginine translocase subunit TatC [Marinilabiliales bacterium]|nr:MAG: twin-arginine translocase subunit TatC [Marinilabiliales bacterium]
MSEKDYSFWDHVDELRKHLLRAFIVFFILFIVLFNFRTLLFDEFLLSLLKEDFITYRWISDIAAYFNLSSFETPEIGFKLINTKLPGQFMAHISVSALVAAIISFPFLVYQLWRFIVPGLYPREKKSIIRSAFTIVFLFFTGAVFAFLIITPLSVLFLGNYQVSEQVENTITLSSYLGVFSTTILLTGLLFELPVVLRVLVRIGIATVSGLKKYRKHAVVVGLILSAIITPTTDPFTMLLVALPVYFLYEISIIFTRRKQKNGS